MSGLSLLYDNKVIKSIREVERDSIRNPKRESFQIGEFIVINSGPLKDLKAVITRNLSDQRVEILYSLLNRAHTTHLDSDAISKNNT